MREIDNVGPSERLAPHIPRHRPLSGVVLAILFAAFLFLVLALAHNVTRWGEVAQVEHRVVASCGI